jgi:hypothetical protein
MVFIFTLSSKFEARSATLFSTSLNKNGPRMFRTRFRAALASLMLPSKSGDAFFVASFSMVAFVMEIILSTAAWIVRSVSKKT